MIERAAAILAALMLSIAVSAGPALAGTAEPSLRVMSFNVRLPVAQDGANRWESRRDLLAQTIAAERPDIIGTQELFQVQGDFIVAQLPQYAWFGRDRRGGHADEHMGIFYNRDRLVVVESGDFWLSNTPDVPGSISWGNLFPRMVSWAVMETRGSERRFALFNTHLPYRAMDESARMEGARLLSNRVAALDPDLPVVVMGDFNTAPDGPVYALLTETLGDTRIAAPEVLGPDGTFHGFTGVAQRRIDWILTRGFKPRRSITVAGATGPPYPSDHFPIVADLDW